MREFVQQSEATRCYRTPAAQHLKRAVGRILSTLHGGPAPPAPPCLTPSQIPSPPASRGHSRPVNENQGEASHSPRAGMVHSVDSRLESSGQHGAQSFYKPGRHLATREATHRPPAGPPRRWQSLEARAPAALNTLAPHTSRRARRALLIHAASPGHSTAASRGSVTLKRCSLLSLSLPSLLSYSLPRSPPSLPSSPAFPPLFLPRFSRQART